MNKKPKILSSRIVASSRLFNIEEMHLQFANGNERHFERIRGSARGAVMIVPMIDDTTVLLVREYGAALERYELAFPKGLIDEGEDALTAANRELQEEMGYAAKALNVLFGKMAISPGYMTSQTDIVLARQLYPAKLPGDEPEPLEVIPWKISDYRQLLTQEEFTDARSIAALLLVKEVYG